MKKNVYLFFVSVFFIISSCSNEGDEMFVTTKHPTISKITPEIVPAGSEIEIIGIDLNDNPVFIFNKKKLKASKITNSSIKLYIPKDASSGKLEIQFNQSEYNKKRYLKISDPNWNELKAAYFFQIKFVSNAVGFAMRQQNGTRKIDKTTDGGKTWDKILQIPSPSSFFEAISSNVIYIRVTSNRIKKTTDGGNTWQNTASLEIGTSIEKIFFKNELEGFILANKLDKTYIYKTIDGGDTWKEALKINTPIHEIEVVYQNNDTSLLLNRKTNQLIKTENNGLSWATSSFNIAKNGDRITYHFIDKNNAWMYVDSILDKDRGFFMTENAGVTWKRIRVPQLYERIVHVTFFNELKGHILTDKGGNLYTSDGGKTWKLFYMDEVGDVHAATSFKNKLYVIKGVQLLKKEIN